MNKLKYVAVFLAIILCFNNIGINAIPNKDIGDNGNIAPTIDLNVTPAKKPVDIVILTDYTGTKLTALNTQINALKAQFSAVNVDPKFHIVSDIKKVGTQNDELYEFVRYGRFAVTYSSYVYYYNYGVEESAAPYTEYFEEEWERTQGLISQYSNLPVRNPTNVYFTKSALQIKKDADEYRKWYNVTIKCANDPSQIEDGVVKEYTYDRHLTTNSHEYVYGSITNEVVSVDSVWNIDTKISDVSYNIYSFDFGKLSTIPLRAGSDRHMMFISDGINKDYSQTTGNYFSFGDMTDSLNTYIKDNNFQLYGVVPNKTRHSTLYPDKVSSIEPYGKFTLFYMENGELLRLGSELLAAQLPSYSKVYPEEGSPVDMSDVKEILQISADDLTYYLMVDGTIQEEQPTSSERKTVEGISDVKQVIVSSNNDLLYLTNGGKVYRYDHSEGEVTAMTGYNYSILKIIYADSKPIFLKSGGVAYGIRDYYDGDEWDYNYIYPIKIRYEVDGREYNKNLPGIKDAKDFRVYYNRTWVCGLIVQYTDDSIEQFLEYDDYRVDSSGDRHIEYPVFYQADGYQCRESNVASLSSTYYSVILHKKDGTTRVISADMSEVKPKCMSASVPIPLNNLTPMEISWYKQYFYKDRIGRIYKFVLDYASPLPVMGSNIVDLGTNVRKITIGGTGTQMYILYRNDDLVEYTYYRGQITEKTYTDVKDIYALTGWQTYILFYNGTVLGNGYSNYGQLGILKPTPPYGSMMNPFNSTLTFDTTQTYYSLLDIFNEILNSKFYPVGRYDTAFNDIYKSYNYSTSGNMYVLLGENIEYKSTYSDYEHDPEYSRKWRISHDPTYFDNSMGISQYHNPTGFTTSPPVKLDKVGKYVINLKARDNPKNDSRFDNYRLWSLGDQNLTVYIHRKPIAMQKITITDNGNGTFTVKALDAGSYDPDHSITRTDKGIVAREWRWREYASTAWTAGQMNKTDCTAEKSYITQLRVKDAEGVWSDYATITIDKNNPPVALFSLDKTLIKNTEYLKVKDQSYPQSFSSIKKWHWIVKKYNSDDTLPSSNIQNAQFPDSNKGTGSLAGYDKNVKYSYTSMGKYRVYLRVKDSNGLWSDGGTDSLAPADLSKYYSVDFVVDKPPAASFVIEKNPIFAEETLMLKDRSAATGISPLMKWHWIVKKLNQDGSVPGENIQDEKFTDSNTGTGEMEGYDVNVKTLYADKGPGTYRIYLRAMNGNNMWSDGGTESAYNLNGFFYRDLVVQESFKMSNFRVVKIRDLHLEPYYNYNGVYIDRPFYVDSMAIDPLNFIVGGISIVPDFGSLTKGYSFEFEIDTTNFNEADDTIVIIPKFFSYTAGVPAVRGPEADLYWEDSDKNIYKAGKGGHSSWAAVTLDNCDRTVTGTGSATWRGEYFIPATSWLAPLGTAAENAKSSGINADIIVNFSIKGYKNGVLKYDYNLQQWPVERTIIKHPYEIGDVIRYDHTKSSLDDTYNIINRP